MFGYKSYRFSMAVTKDQLLNVYSGAVKRFRVRSVEGLVLDIDAKHLRQFTTEDGIYGLFELTTTADNKFLKITKIG